MNATTSYLNMRFIGLSGLAALAIVSATHSIARPDDATSQVRIRTAADLKAIESITDPAQHGTQGVGEFRWTQGALNSDTEWSGHQEISAVVTVPKGVTLTIDPGANLLMTGYWDSRLDVEGTLIAVGTREKPITIRSEGTGHYWGGINFKGPDAGGRVEYTELINGRSAAVSCDGASPTIQNNHISNDTMLEGGIALYHGSKAIVRDNDIRYLEVERGANGILSVDSEPLLAGNRIAHFKSAIHVVDSGNGLRPQSSLNYADEASTVPVIEQIEGPPPGLPKIRLEYVRTNGGPATEFSASPSSRYVIQVTGNLGDKERGPIILQDLKSGRELGQYSEGTLVGVDLWAENAGFAIIWVSTEVRTAASISSRNLLLSLNLKNGNISDLSTAAESDFRSYFKGFKSDYLTTRLAGYLGGDTILIETLDENSLQDILQVSLANARIVRRNVPPPGGQRWMIKRPDGLFEYRHSCCDMESEGSLKEYRDVFDAQERKWIDGVYVVTFQQPDEVRTRIFTHSDSIEVQNLASTTQSMFPPKNLAGCAPDIQKAVTSVDSNRWGAFELQCVRGRIYEIRSSTSSGLAQDPLNFIHENPRIFGTVPGAKYSLQVRDKNPNARDQVYKGVEITAMGAFWEFVGNGGRPGDEILFRLEAQLADTSQWDFDPSWIVSKEKARDLAIKYWKKKLPEYSEKDWHILSSRYAIRPNGLTQYDDSDCPPTPAGSWYFSTFSNGRSMVGLVDGRTGHVCSFANKIKSKSKPKK